MTIALIALLAGDSVAPAATAPDFQRDVRPLLADRCFSCHGPDEAARKRGLRLDTFAGATAELKSGRRAIVPGDLAASEMARRLLTDDDRKLMPPESLHRPLQPTERDLLLRWIETGARYETHWAFVAPQRPPLPPLRDDGFSRDPLDQWVRARMAAAGLTPAPPSDRPTWLRRATFALHGLPPTPAELQAFLADEAPGAEERVLDRLFASRHYGERMAADWLDVARYADTFGYQSDWECHTWPWRDWVIQAFQRDLPWDRFLTEQLAGDLLPDADASTRIATAFNRLHRQTNEGGSIDEEFRQEAIADRVATFGTAFLGLTLECARCHDHKYDPIPTREFHRLGAFFGAIDEAGSYPYATGALPPPTLRLTDAAQSTELARLAAERATAEAALAAAQQAAAAAFAAELAAGALPPQRIDPPVAARHEPLDGTIAGATGAPAGMATALDGDHGPNLAVHPFRRSDPLSLRLHVATPDRKAHAVVLHTSVFTIESDPQGFELLLEEGHLHWRVVHCWPGSAAAIRTTAPFPIGRFVDVVATWDGSSRAAGLALHLDGVPVATEVVRDGLAGLAATRTLQVGFRDRDVGLAGGRVDDLSLFDRALTALECAELHAAGGGGALAAIEVGAWRAHAVAHAPAVVAAMARARAARAAHDEFHDALPELMVMAATPHPRPAFVLLRGRYDAPDHSQPVAPDGALDALLPFDPAWPHDRLGLALWCSDPRHPLVARVAVNRLFAQCFGRGLVETQENFGLQGAPPVQRELLDLLAVDFIESGFRVQALLRRLLLSATFRQESGGTVERHAVDPRNELLARGPALRLTAEMVRDQALHAAGLLNPEVGGRSVRPWQPPGLWEEAGASGSYTADTGPAAWRRSLYTFRKRTAPPPSLLLFDAGSREQCQARRLPTNTPLQALALQNDRDFVVAAVALARRAAVDPDPLGAAFLRLVSRPPRPDERAALERFLARERERFAGEPERAAALLAAGADALPPAPVAEAGGGAADPVALAALALACQLLLLSDLSRMVR